MHTRPLALLLLLVLALPASAGELIRYRTFEGTIGFVDDEKRLPPGVEVLSRTPLDPPASRVAAEPPPAPADAEPAALPAAAASLASSPEDGAAADDGDCDALHDLLARTRCRSAHEERCTHYGLPPRCSAEQIASAEGWCARSAALREELAGVDDARQTAQARHTACLRRSSLRPYCDRDELDEAEQAARVADRRIEALEEQCHAEGCLPGWVREQCTYAAGH